MSSCIDRLQILILSSTFASLACAAPVHAVDAKLGPGPYTMKNLETGKSYYAIVDATGKIVSLSEKNPGAKAKTVQTPAPAPAQATLFQNPSLPDRA